MNFKLFLVALAAALCISFSARADTAEAITLRYCQLLDTVVHPGGTRYDLWACGTHFPFGYVMIPTPFRWEGERNLIPMGPPLREGPPSGIEI